MEVRVLPAAARTPRDGRRDRGRLLSRNSTARRSFLELVKIRVPLRSRGSSKMVSKVLDQAGGVLVNSMPPGSSLPSYHPQTIKVSHLLVVGDW